MGDFVLFDKTAQLGKGYFIAFVNRSQLLYFFLFLPKFLQFPYLFFVILAVGLLSQLNLFVLSKCLSFNYSQMGYQGLAGLLGKKPIRLIATVGIGIIFIKMSFIILGYSELIQQFIFPSMKQMWLILFILLISIYIASQGMEKTMRFGIIAFMCTFWIIFLYIPTFSPKFVKIYDLYPIFRNDVAGIPWKGILMVWSSLSGPEFLILLLPWINSREKIMKYLSIGNAISILEYLTVFIACLFFFGTNYLRKINFPVVNMVKYMQSPIIERVEILMISLQMFYYVFFVSILLLCLYGAIRISIGRQHKETTRKGFFLLSIFVLAGLFFINAFLWREGEELNKWVNLQLWTGALTYLLVPSALLTVIKIKGKSSQ